ncbi:RagB/SusD family nutrient uptake outer membrane protein [Pedobacter caeni]|uniref:Starch-binding associating with outer membrane n=1 Tax=Pedobacter caeni TaxID=288992 RepID=A0A1M5ELN3_9SPHI|nr:RagB/SusD family nutrient uptake outer membrane protein [Pedobacter caeni]SHF80054.1 Starch-binding associating with outer membrane [Pedobacter caeni]
MKTNKLYIGLFLLMAAMGCKKSELEQNVPDQLTVDNFWINKDRALAGLSAAYSQVEGFVSWDNYVEARSVREFYREDYVVPGADAYNYPWWTEHYNFDFTSGNYAIDLLWRENYRGINFANQVLENVSKMSAAAIDDASKKQILAEAKFLRAYYHFKVLTNFSKVIIRDKVPTSDADLSKAFSERAEVYGFILKDLQEAEPDLPLRSARPATELGRITRGAAQAYLGKVNLYRVGDDQSNATAYYAEAGNWFNKVILSNEYKLDDNFLGMFNGTTKNSTESVFELQQTEDETSGALYKSYLSDWVAASELGGYGEIYGTPGLLTEMLKEGEVANGNYDARVYQTMYFNDAYFNDTANPRVYGKTYDAVFGKDAKTIAFRKWIPAGPDRIGFANAINVPLMRYADVLLMYAEVLNEQQKPGDALTWINKVRGRAGLPDVNLNSKALIFDQIVHERIMEFTLEGSRFYDLRRWGMLSQKMQAAGRKFSPEQAFYPTPFKESTNNPSAQ